MEIIAFVVYNILIRLRSTTSFRILQGVLVLLVIMWVSTIFDLRSINFLLSHAVQWGVLALMIIFQPELRKILERLGRTRFSLAQLRKTLNNLGGSANSFEYSSNMMRCINAICDSCAMLLSLLHI